MPGESLNKFISLPRRDESWVGPGDLDMAEANHRIANNLSLISTMLSMRAREIEQRGIPMLPLAAAEHLLETGTKIQVIADLHRMLSAAGEGPVDLGAYLERIGEAVIGSLVRNQEIDYWTEFDDGCACAADHASHLGLIVNELLINAIKYAHPAERVRGRIELGCRRGPGGLEVWVIDDGVGLPDGFDPHVSSGLGMRTMRAIARKIGARIEFDSSCLGVAARVLLPATGSLTTDGAATAPPAARE
jgi:two-component sensor histidine kinase